MLLAMKDEAESNLNNEDNDFMLDTSYGEDTMEELTVVVMLMARIQPADGNAETVPSYDAKAVSKVNASSKVHDQMSHVKCKPIIHTSDDDQIYSNIIFDDPFMENNGVIVHFGNDQFALILGYGDLVQGNITINRVYYVEGHNHNLFSGHDLLTGNHGSDIYTTSLQETTSSTSVCFMAKASPTQAWLWHRRLSHLNFDYINLLLKKDVMIGLLKLKYVKDQLCSSCEVSKAKRSSFKTKAVPSLKGQLNLLHMDLCGPIQVASINGKKYILVIIDDYSRYTWTLFLKSKDETPEVLKDFLTMI
nr:hypothetical protein [Tanacetum cinerariifolium]